jgi:hypothetical protein
MNGAPPPPANQPEPRAQEPAPAVAAGFGFQTAKDWFLKFTNFRQLANGEHQERVDGVRVSLALSLMSAVTLGWYHASTIGGSLTHIKGKDFKLGLVAYLGFINANKTEISKTDKDEYIFGIKLSHVTGKKNKFQGSNRLSNSAVEKAEFTNKCAEYWALRKEVASALKETIATLNREHASVEESLQKCTKEFEKAKFDSTDASVKATSLNAKIDNLLQEASSAKTHATSSFKVIADSAAAFEAGAAWEGDLGSQLKLHCSSQEFAASISKLG